MEHSKSEYKRLSVQNPQMMAEHIFKLEEENRNMSLLLKKQHVLLTAKDEIITLLEAIIVELKDIIKLGL